MKEERYCQSCAMPLVNEEDFGTNKDGSQNVEFCSYCFKDGAYTLDCSMETMIDHNLEYLDEMNKSFPTPMSKSEAKAMMMSFFPELKRWKNTN